MMYGTRLPLSSMLRQSALSGTVSGLLMAAVIAGTSRMRTGRTAPGLNAVSHMFWGSQAGRQANWSVRYTLNGLLLNQLACLFWSGCFEALYHDRPSNLPRQGVPHVIMLSFVAYLVDYHMVPKRCTPGFELLFPRAWYPWLYAGLALSLWGGAQIPVPSLRQIAHREPVTGRFK